jgi:hypothetical protein
MEPPVALNSVRDSVWRLRKVLAGSRYEIINHPTLGYELIVVPEDGCEAWNVRFRRHRRPARHSRRSSCT